MEEYTKKFSAFHLQVKNVILKSIVEAGEKGYKSVTIEFGPENVGFRFQLNISPDILKKLIMEEDYREDYMLNISKSLYTFIYEKDYTKKSSLN